ncbi:MAG: ABC transporter ATP-binding protein [Candidatus Marinimicrobia bacterium]|nr:ABC transporter ATP-binding protein [Candidatus Neomarinimicrobiota bacterium]
MINIVNINKSFSNQTILNNISFKINDGDAIAIIGKSGIGKSVLLKHLNGLIYPDSGHISVDGKIINKLKFFELEKMRSKISMVFQFGALFDSMSVFENIEMPLEKMSLMNKEERAARIYDVLKEVGMEGTHNKFPDELSGGMKKRVGIARAIAVKPKYILYDEPTTGLDPIMANSINKLISKLHTLESVTSIIVTHEMDTVFNVANRVIMINDGEIRFNGSPDELLSSEDEMVKQFIRVNTHK